MRELKYQRRKRENGKREARETEDVEESKV